MKTGGKWIVFEGLDKSGKTTLAKKLANNSFNIKYLKGICSPTYLGYLTRRFPSALLFTIEALVTGLKAKSWKKKGYIVVQDRYIGSVACHLPKSDNFPNNIISRLALKFFPKPDYLIYLTVEKAERIRRMKNQTENNPHENWLIENHGWIDARDNAYERYYSEFPNKKLKLDTSLISILETQQKISLFIK